MIGICENCGNNYDKAFIVVIDEEEHIFDSFECAINKVAPRCHHCHTPIIGHGIEFEENFFCCGRCAKSASTHIAAHSVTYGTTRILLS